MTHDKLLRFGRGSVWKIFPQRMTQLINDRVVCRTAPATPGLLIIETEEEKKKSAMVGQKSDMLFDQRSPINKEGPVQ